jgi:hypothetical protein
MTTVAFAIRDFHPRDSAHAGRTQEKTSYRIGRRLSMKVMIGMGPPRQEQLLLIKPMTGLMRRASHNERTFCQGGRNPWLFLSINRVSHIASTASLKLPPRTHKVRNDRMRLRAGRDRLPKHVRSPGIACSRDSLLHRDFPPILSAPVCGDQDQIRSLHSEDAGDFRKRCIITDHDPYMADRFRLKDGKFRSLRSPFLISLSQMRFAINADDLARR